MASISVSRIVDADADDVAAAMHDVEPFVRSAGFDEVRYDGETVEVAKEMGPMRIELTLEVVAEPDAEVVHVQREGIFESMRTAYRVAAHEDGVEVTAETEFSLKTAVVGPVLDATVIKQVRRMELDNQFDYLEERASAPRDGPVSPGEHPPSEVE